jgi:hypothetical protein
MFGLQCSVKLALKMSDPKPKRICKGSSKILMFKGWELNLRLFLACTVDGGEPNTFACVPLGKGNQLNWRLGRLQSRSGSFGEEKNHVPCEIIQMDSSKKQTS